MPLKRRDLHFVDAPVISVIAQQRIEQPGLDAMLHWLALRDPDCLPQDPVTLTNCPTRLSRLLPGLRSPAGHPAPDAGVTDNELLAELSGRLCYRSFGEAAGRKNNSDYMQHIFSMDPLHASIAYHAKMTFFFAGVSRKLSHQFIRNYVGSDRSEEGSPSQESSRFCEHHGYYVVPPAYEEADRHRLTTFRAACQSNWNTYQDELEVMFQNYETEHKMEPKGASKKRIFEAAAGLLNQYTETSFVWTTNPIALRKFLKERCNPAADAEIDRFARSLARICFMTWPNLFLGDDLDGVRLRCGVRL